MNRKKVSRTIALSMTIGAFLCTNVTALAAWQQEEAGWWNSNGIEGGYSVGWECLNDQWYYFDQAGWMSSGWQYVDGEWYFLGDKEDGSLKTGWVLVGDSWYYLTPSGQMASGWQYIGDEWYYLGDAGDGSMKTGWAYLDGNWYYFTPSGSMASGWQYIGDEWYYLGDTTDGSMKIGWYQIDRTWYYFYGTGAMASKVWIGDYYLHENGSMAVNTWIGDYFVGSHGEWEADKKDYFYETLNEVRMYRYVGVPVESQMKIISGTEQSQKLFDIMSSLTEVSSPEPQAVDGGGYFAIEFNSDRDGRKTYFYDSYNQVMRLGDKCFAVEADFTDWLWNTTEARAADIPERMLPNPEAANLHSSSSVAICYTVDMDDPKNCLDTSDYVFIGRVENQKDTEYIPWHVSLDGTYEEKEPFTPYDVTVLKGLKGGLTQNQQVTLKRWGTISDESIKVDEDGAILPREGGIYLFAVDVQEDGTWAAYGKHTCQYISGYPDTSMAEIEASELYQRFQQE